MRNVKVTLIVAGLLALATSVVAWVSGAAAAEPHPASMSLPFWLSLAASNHYVRVLPLLAVVVLGATAVVESLRVRKQGNQEQRQALLAWIGIASAAALLDTRDVVFFLITQIGPQVVLFMHVCWALGSAAWVAAVVVAAHIQQGAWKSGGTVVRGWHVAASASGLLFFGPAALVPPAWVWLRSRHAANSTA